MAADRYSAGTLVAFVDHRTKKIVEDKIWLVRRGYYHMPSDDYLHDENIVGSIVDGKRIPNDLFVKDREEIVANAEQQMLLAKSWSIGH